MKDTDALVSRLAAINPVPLGTALDRAVVAKVHARVLAAQTPDSRPRYVRLRSRRLALGLAAAALAVPAATLANDVGRLLGFSNEGAPVPTSDVPAYQDAKLGAAIDEMRWPSRMKHLGDRNGIAFYAVQNADGEFCFAIHGDSDPAPLRAVGCAPAGVFPSLERPIIGVPLAASHGSAVATPTYVERFAGFAADGVVSVELVDAEGATIASAPVSGNLYAAADVPRVLASAIVARDAHGDVVYRQPLTRSVVHDTR